MDLVWQIQPWVNNTQLINKLIQCSSLQVATRREWDIFPNSSINKTLHDILHRCLKLTRIFWRFDLTINKYRFKKNRNVRWLWAKQRFYHRHYELNIWQILLTLFCVINLEQIGTLVYKLCYIYIYIYIYI